MDSSDYYSKNAGEYFERTVNLDMQEYYDRFTKMLPDCGSILDLGCGSGRDSAYFVSCGYDVTAMDASEEMCDLASVHIGQDVLHLPFADMDFEEVFDGVWACASLLHVSSNEIDDIMAKIIKSIKPNGILFMSFRYGDFEGERDGRYYTDYNSRKIKDLISRQEGLNLLEIRKCEDVRPENDVIWISALVHKNA